MIDLASWDAVIALQAIQLAYDRSLWGSLSDAQWDAVENILAYLSERLQGAVGPTP